MEELSVSIHRLAASLPRYNHSFRAADIPVNGIYLMFEKGEAVSHPHYFGDRIVRVGTHKVDGRLPTRLRTHFRGNRRASILRRHPANVMAAEQGYSALAASAVSEEQISTRIADRFSFVCVRVPTQAERLAIESGLIALLASYPLARPSAGWPGLLAHSVKIWESGLRNVLHVHGVPLSCAGLDRFRELVGITKEDKM